MHALRRIEAKLDYIITRLFTMSANVSANFLALQAQVQATTSVEQSAITLIEGLAQQLAQAITASQNGDTSALPSLQQQLSDSSALLAAAITANTVQPAPPPPPPPAPSP